MKTTQSIFMLHAIMLLIQFIFKISISIKSIPIVASQKWSLATSGAKQTKSRKLLLKFLVLKNEKIVEKAYNKFQG